MFVVFALLLKIKIYGIISAMHYMYSTFLGAIISIDAIPFRTFCYAGHIQLIAFIF